ncbi:3D (Asp-Asp-Asp) domain-containing protein [Amycolatopsis thermophila]|uniref:3D (Asp-Asp-Asp) domain-containing protein n=1 Tax=Amycolatopsis thermophila TaxID=206084 RepID=A0ABU0F760_9PSEU|nr:3D (Asp-Asp-Asp) domain-containing protein [Amycolatopsis thermophila]
MTPEPTPAPPPVTTLPALPKPAPPKPATPPASTTSPPPSASSRPSTTKTTPPPLVGAPNARGLITFYAAADNDPPGSREIAYPGTVHQRAGGTGTFTDPLTFAAEAGQFAPGTKIYVPAVRRYFVLEDTCATCSGSHIDLWAGPATDQGVVACEESLTRDGAQPYQVDPPPGLPTAPGDLYTGGRCYPA